MMTSELPLISEGSGTDVCCSWTCKSHYVLMDFRDSDSGLLVLYEKRKLTSVTFRRTVYVATVLCAFTLGLVLGAVIPIFSVPKRSPVPVSAKLADGTKDITDRFNVMTREQNFVEAKESSFKKRLLDGVFWSDSVEKSLPFGFEDESDRLWREFVHDKPILRIEEGCGRMQNRLVTFDDGSKACCRYRQNTDQIQGELFSYYLGRSLKLRNLVPSTIVIVNSSDVQWALVKDRLVLSQWKEGHPVVLTKFVEHLQPASIPHSVRNYTADILNIKELDTSPDTNLFYSFNQIESGDTKISLDHIRDLKDATEMAQWSDLLVFDYLTANLDRVVNNLYNLQWNRAMLRSPAHNLARSQDLLLFLDNESGLLHGYRLLDKYEPYHALLLNGLCYFRK